MKSVHVSNFQSSKCKGEVLLNPVTKVFTIRGTSNGKTLRYLAAAPPDFRQSYAGSGLPFPNEEIAYDHTANVGELQLTNGQFQFQIMYPNSYYVNSGSTLIKPHVHIVIDETDAFDVKLGQPLVPNRSLKHLDGRPRRSDGGGRATTGGRN